MTRTRPRDVVLIEVAALILALISASGVLGLEEDGLQRGLMIMGIAASISLLKFCWQRLLPGIIAATILMGLASGAMTAGAPKIVPAALVGLALLAIVSRNPDVRRAWAEGRWFRSPQT